MTESSRVRVLVADDHPTVRYGLRAVLGSDPSVQLVGEAGAGEQAVALAAETVPDVVLMDVTMPGLNGIEATRRILGAMPSVRIVMLTMYDDSASVLAAIRAGARGYLLKGADRDEILRAVHAAAGGAGVFAAAATEHLAARVTGARTPGAAAGGLPGLTERERELLDLMARGLTNAAIADRFRISPKTVRNHTSTIVAKLGEQGRAGAVARARAAGLGGPDEAG